MTTVVRTLTDLRPDWDVAAAARTTPAAHDSTDVPVVVVFRLTADSTAALPILLDDLRRAGLLSRTVLVPIREGLGPRPPAARARVRMASAVVADVVELPYVLRWTYAGSDSPPSPAYRRAADRLVAALERVAADTTVPAIGD